MTRDEALALLEAREGYLPEHAVDTSTEDVVAAAEAPDGQPCGDCGALVVYGEEGWEHVHGWRGHCFLAYVHGEVQRYADRA